MIAALAGVRIRRIVAAITTAVGGTVLLGVGGLGGAAGVEEVAEPRLYLEVPGRIAAGAPFEAFVSSSVPAAIAIRYGDEEVAAIEQDLRATFVGVGGRVALEVEATDGAGRTAHDRSIVEGVLLPKPTMEAPTHATVGDPLSVRVTWAPAERPPGVALAFVADAWVELEGRILDALVLEDGLLALAALPLADPPGKRLLRAVVVDEFGTWHRIESAVHVGPNPHPVQMLSIPASVLAVSTDEGRALEARTLSEAFAAVPLEPRWREPFLLPIEGRGTSGFGLPRRYGVGGNVSYHLGTDIAAPEGTPILATNDGVVRVAGQYPIKGGLVILDHGFGVTSLYFHQSRLAVEVGDEVARGDVIGYVGTTGLSTGPHLHWEMRIDGVPTDPLAWIGRHHPLPLAAVP